MTIDEIITWMNNNAIGIFILVVILAIFVYSHFKKKRQKDKQQEQVQQQPQQSHQNFDTEFLGKGFAELNFIDDKNKNYWENKLKNVNEEIEKHKGFYSSICKRQKEIVEMEKYLREHIYTLMQERKMFEVKSKEEGLNGKQTQPSP
jgi:c-di-AMP phosphodiesterase-like protein